MAALSVARMNVNVAASLLLSGRMLQSDIVLSGLPGPDHWLLFDDSVLYHYTTPFTPRFPGLASTNAFVVAFDAKSYLTFAFGGVA